MVKKFGSFRGKEFGGNHSKRKPPHSSCCAAAKDKG
jgi:hypothetical protein